MDTPQPTPQTPASPAAPAAPAAPATPASIQYDDFAKIELRVATVTDCQPHPNADKLLVLQIDLGNEKRQICAGLKQWIKPEELVGKQVVVVANLAPRMMRGQVSQGMLLAATDASSGNVVVLGPASPVAAGSGVK
jgi:methionyl-tRNA synthetase